MENAGNNSLNIENTQFFNPKNIYYKFKPCIQLPTVFVSESNLSESSAIFNLSNAFLTSPSSPSLEFSKKSIFYNLSNQESILSTSKNFVNAFNNTKVFLL